MQILSVFEIVQRKKKEEILEVDSSNMENKRLIVLQPTFADKELPFRGTFDIGRLDSFHILVLYHGN